MSWGGGSSSTSEQLQLWFRNNVWAHLPSSAALLSQIPPLPPAVAKQVAVVTDAARQEFTVWYVSAEKYALLAHGASEKYITLAHGAAQVYIVAAQQQVEFVVNHPSVTQAMQNARKLGKENPEIAAGIAAVLLVLFLRILPILIYKAKLMIYSFFYMLFSRDNSGLKKQTPPKMSPSSAQKILGRRIVVFIRHGESEWNLVFNKSPKIMVPFRLVMALFREVFAFSLSQDSIFFDSPLNREGREQGEHLEKVIREALEKSDASLRPANCMYVTSPLRRAITTLLLAFRKRFKEEPLTRVKVWHCLQEISRNVDTQSLTPKFEKPLPAATLSAAQPDCAEMYRKFLDPSEFSGSKTFSRTGVKRVKEFAEKTFEKKTDMNKTLVVGGHSLWFKNFFNIFLPSIDECQRVLGGAGSHQAILAELSRTKKIRNGGMVSFILEKVEERGTIFYRINPTTIKELHLGFEGNEKLASVNGNEALLKKKM